MANRFVSAFFCVLLALSSCKHTNSETESQTDIEKITESYTKASSKVLKKQYLVAIADLEKINEEYPYSHVAPNISVLLAYSHFKLKQYEEAVAIIDMYLKIYPADESADYMLYLKILSLYSQIKSHHKDKTLIQNTLDIISLLKQKYPESEYSSKTEDYETNLQNSTYLGNLDIAMQYHRNQNCIAAIPRYLELHALNNPLYHKTTADHLASCFDELGITPPPYLADKP